MARPKAALAAAVALMILRRSGETGAAMVGDCSGIFFIVSPPDLVMKRDVMKAGATVLSVGLNLSPVRLYPGSILIRYFGRFPSVERVVEQRSDRAEFDGPRVVIGTLGS